jgi:predicted metal-dependent phosphoesterase TrpH
VARKYRLADRLATLGLPVTYEAALSRAASEESLGRPHFAQVLVENGAATDVSDAFDRFLATGRPGYVAKDRLTPAEAAAVARSSGAVAVLAHPMTLGLSIGALGAAVGELAEAGLVGLEAYYGRYTPQVRIGLAQLAQRTGLVATGGSDFHGLAKPELSVGTGTGDLSVPDRALEQLEARRAELSRH